MILMCLWVSVTVPPLLQQADQKVTSDFTRYFALRSGWPSAAPRSMKTHWGVVLGACPTATQVCTSRVHESGWDAWHCQAILLLPDQTTVTCWRQSSGLLRWVSRIVRLRLDALWRRHWKLQNWKAIRRCLPSHPWLDKQACIAVWRSSFALLGYSWGLMSNLEVSASDACCSVHGLAWRWWTYAHGKSSFLKAACLKPSGPSQ